MSRRGEPAVGRPAFGRWAWVGWASLALGCAPPPAPIAPTGPAAGPSGGVTRRQDPVIYGTDDRDDAWQVQDEGIRRLLLLSSVMLLKGGVLDASDPQAPRLTGALYGEVENLCVGEPFADQPVLGDCSGTLVQPDVVLLAAHCLPQGVCPNPPFVLAPHYEGPGQLAVVRPGDVRRCAEVLVWRDNGAFDLALVRLEAPFERGVAAPVRPATEALLPGEPLMLLGFPRGIPAKAALGNVLESLPGGELSVVVDAYQGNSGGGLFDRQGRLVGHLSEGREDFVRQGPCNVSQVLAGDGSDGGERGVTWAATLAVACEAHPERFDCAGGGGTTQGPEGWSCPGSEYADGLVCHCGCSLPDPDCDDPQAPVRGCAEGFRCTEAGACVRDDGAGEGEASGDEGGCMASAAWLPPLWLVLGLGAGRRRRRRR